MPKYYVDNHDWFIKHKLPPPATYSHGTEEDIEKKFKKLKPFSWRMEGNKLIGQTEMGPLVQYLPTDMICTGTDDEGLPILSKVVL